MRYRLPHGFLVLFLCLLTTGCGVKAEITEETPLAEAKKKVQEVIAKIENGSASMETMNDFSLLMANLDAAAEKFGDPFPAIKEEAKKMKSAYMGGKTAEAGESLAKIKELMNEIGTEGTDAE